jgi:hypothetical protein
MARAKAAALWQTVYDEREDLGVELARDRLNQLQLRSDAPRPLPYLETALQLWDDAGEDQFFFYLSFEELVAHANHPLSKKILAIRPDTWKVSSQETHLDAEIEKALYGLLTRFVLFVCTK